MKVDRSKLKKSSSEVPADCKVIIDTIKGLSQEDLLRELKDFKTWSFGKCELYHWADVLDIFDAILEKACQKETDKKWTLLCDLPGNEQLKSLLLEVLRFTALLIEHSFSRHLYNSMDHLTTLLTSCDMSAVLYVLNLLYVFSKRSNFISRMSPEKKQGLIQRLVHLAESWGGKENGFGLAECCQDLPKETYPPSATTLHFEFYAENKDEKNKKTQQTPSNVIQSIHMENVDKTGLMPSQIMEEIMATYAVPEEKQIVLFTHVRLACLFSNYDARVHCVQARLQAISILVYSIAMQDNMNVILYPGLIEELVDIVEIKGPALVDIKSAALRTLTSVIHIERNPSDNRLVISQGSKKKTVLTSIIDATGASSYHGFLPVLVRTCIQHMIDPSLKPFPQTYATSLFSFLYHLASYDNGVEALVSCGMMESLLKVINWYGEGQEHITFVTRAVRVIDLITNLDMAAFQGLGGLQAFINRLEHEVNLCREEQPFEILPNHGDSVMMESSDVSPMDMSSSSMTNASGVEEAERELENQQQQQQQQQQQREQMANAGSAEIVNDRLNAPAVLSTPTGSEETAVPPTSSTIREDGIIGITPSVADMEEKKSKHCFAQRAALLKSMLNFMKKAIPDMSFADSIRHLMDGSLPKSLKHIISNAEYYGPSLFLLATDVVTVYVFQEPSLLSSLQDKGLTDVVLHALLVKDVPATREVLASLPNVFSALCLNARGLEAFVACKPFDRLFKVLLSPDYLPAMRRRRSSDPFGDTASNLGNAMDELMRHQPSLRTDATKAIIKLLEEICYMGENPHFICQKQQPKTDASSAQSSVRSPQSNEASSSDEEDEEEVEMPHMPPSITATTHLNVSQTKITSARESMPPNQRQAIPLMDYVLNVMKFVEAILSNNSTDDHCREFVLHKGLNPLISILGLPNLPIDFPSSPACQAVSSVCKSVLTLSREPQVLKQGLLQMNVVLHLLQHLHQPLEAPGGSVLLRELADCSLISDATLCSASTPLLHSLAAAHAYIMMFVHVCRMGQTDIRTISVNHWGSDLGLEVLKGLSSLYNSLVWESTVLLALCNEDYLPPDCQFGRADLEKLLTKDAREKSEAGEGGETLEENKLPSAMNEGEVRTDLPASSTTQQQSLNSVGTMQMETQSTLASGEECMDTSETDAVVADPGVSASNAASSSSNSAERQPSPEGALQQQHLEGSQSLNLPFTGVTASTSSASIDSDNLLGASGQAGNLIGDKDPKKKVSPAMQAQLRQLKPLLTLSSRLGRALSELFVLLVKLSVGSPVRQRRSQPAPTPTIPSPAARDVALALTKLLAGGLSFKPPAYSPQPKLRMTFLVCSAGFTAPMLFDEKKQPYHLMLQKFVECGGQAALFQSFSWALSMDGKVPLSEGLEHPDLPEGTGEFLDSWLNLVEKMVNPKMVLESPHTLPPKGKAPGVTPFDPVQYLITTQKAAFNAVMNLWNKTPLKVHGGRISESVLAILCHIIYGESLLQKQTEKEKAAAASGTGDNAVDLSGAGPSGQLGGANNAEFTPFTNFLLGGGGSGSGSRTAGGANAGGPSLTAAVMGVSGAGGSGSVGGGGGGGSGGGGGNFSDAALITINPHMSYNVNLAHLNQLMDMGFTRHQASVALQNTTSLEQATEYILTHPIPSTHLRPSSPTPTYEWAGGSGNLMDVDDEEGQIMKAIAMSLGENAIMSTDQPKNGKDKKPGADTEEKQEDEEPLDTAVLDEFTQNIFPGCLKLVDTLPETVYRVCDLLIVVMYRNGQQWKKDTLACLCADLSELCKEMTAYAEENNVSKMLESSNALKFGTRLHLLSLLGEEMSQCVAVAMQMASLPSIMTTLLVASKNALLAATTQAPDTDVSTERTKLTPKWLAPLLLLLDMWEKISVTIKRKISARIVVGSNRIWKWFDDSSGRWCKYSTSNNTTIDEAFKRGESFVRFQAGRRKYSVQFGTMIQLNEETGNRRPVMLSVPTAEDRPPGKKDQSKETVQNEQIAEEVRKEFEVPDNLDNFLSGFTPEVIHVIISALSAYLSIPLTPDCLHATMRLILRLTREHKFAEQFVCEGGAQRLLSLTEDSNFQGFLNLATLIFRHILEEPVSLRYCMEKVMRNVCAGMGSCRSGVSQGGVGSKEMHYVLRVLGPAACRNLELFSHVAKDALQITLPFNGKVNAPQFLKCTPTKQLESLVNPWIKNFIRDLLNALIVCNKETPQGKSTEKPMENIVDALNNFMSECQNQQSRDGSNHAWPTTSTASSVMDRDAATASAATTTKDTTPSADESPASSKQLIPKSAILRLLSEIIRSYGNCVQLITHYTYQAGQSDLVPESCTVLAFVLDNLLSNCQNVGDKDCPTLTRVFIASIASCSLSPDAQMALVTEVKGALQRALALPEGSAKHQRVQALSNIISTMIESCHNPTQLPSHFFKGQQMINNNMMKILIKKNMLVDLARIPHSLDLSSPFLAATVNSILKPMETLSRSVNSPDKFIPMKKGDHITVPDQGGTTTQVVSEPAATGASNDDNQVNQTNAMAGSQMNVTIEDVTNNPEAQSNLEVTTDHHIVEPESFNREQGLDDVLSQILQTNTGTDPESQVLSEMTISQVGESTTVDDNEILIDVEVEGDDDDYENGHHDSQMVSQVLSDEEDDADVGDNDRDPDDNQDDVSGDDEDYDEADQEEMGEDDDEEDEEDEDDEDDEETSDMDGEGDGDGFQEIRNPFELDDMIFHMEDFSPRSRRRQNIYIRDESRLGALQLPLNLGDNDAGNDAMPSLPPAPSLITNSHPLLMRSVEGHTSRAHRSGRSRLRPMPRPHVNLSSTARPTNTPVILQRILAPAPATFRANRRLLGPSTAAEILQLTTSLGSHTPGVAGPSRVVVAGDNLPFLQRPEDDSFIEEIFQDSDDTSGVLSCIPSTLTRWTEETKVLDGDGVHDLVTTLKPPLIEELIRKRDEELEERKEKRKKTAESSAAESKKKDKPESSATEMSRESENKNEPSMGTSGDASSGQSSQAAEMLASEIVEQVLSTMVSSSTVTPTTTQATTTPGATTATTVSVLSFLQSPLSSPMVSSPIPNLPPPPPPSSLPAPMPSPDHPMPVFAPQTQPPPPTTTSDILPPLPSHTWQISNQQPTPPSSSLSSSTPAFPPPPHQLNADPVWSRYTSSRESAASGAVPVTSAPATSINSSSLLPLSSSSSMSSSSSTSMPSSIQQQQHQTSLISQLLDSIVPNPSSAMTNPSSSQSVFATTPMMPSSAAPLVASELPVGSSVIQGQNILSTSPSVSAMMTTSQSQPNQSSQSNQRTMCWSFMQQFGFSATQQQQQCASPSSSANTAPINSQAGQQMSGGITATSAGGLNPALVQMPMDTSTSLMGNPMARFDSLDPTQDLDFSMIFSPQTYSGGGVTGATPPLSNLSFGGPQSVSAGSDNNTLSNTLASISASSDNLTTADGLAMPAGGVGAAAAGSGGGIGDVGGGNAAAAGSSSSGAGSSSNPIVGESSTDPEIPEGVDPSFLAALPEHIRQEVISEQLRLQRIRRRAEEQAQASASMTSNSTGETNNVTEVNPEFLAALPPAIQEEVLAQQRAEQARLVAQQNATNPDMPVDPATFFSTLPSSLRQQVLSDMDDSMLAVLPPELLTEAQELRRNMEERHRRRMQEPSIIGFLRDCGLASRLGTRFAITCAQRRNESIDVLGGTGANAQSKIKGRFMLDPEALTCLLVLLFIDDPKLNTARLHKVFRNLCYHGPTRAWLIRALISIIQKSGDLSGGNALMSSLCVEEKGSGSGKDKGKGKKSVHYYNTSTTTPSSSSSSSVNSSSIVIQQPSSEVAACSLAAAAAATPMQLEQQQSSLSSSSSLSGTPAQSGSQQRSSAGSSSSSTGLWLSISLEAALGCRANVFQIQRAPGKKLNTSTAQINIHPQAAPVVCRHTLDTLISLAKNFPSHFLPTGKAKEAKCGDGKKEETNNQVPKKSSAQQATSQQQQQQHSTKPSESATPASASTAAPSMKPENDFWNILVRLDNASGKSKGKGVQRCHSMSSSDGENTATDYTSSALGQLMGMLSHPVVRRSQLLTDRLLRLLGLISVSLPDNCRPSTSSASSSAQPSSTTATTTTTNAVMGNATATTATSSSATTPTATSGLGIPTSTTTANVGVTADITEESGDGMKSESGEEDADKSNRIVVDEGQPILQEELKLAVEVLTSKSCSEEGLEDATNLLLQLSWANPATRAAVLDLLLSGARQLGMLVCGHIQELLEQLSKLNSQLDVGGESAGAEASAAASGDESGTGSGAAGSSKVTKGVLTDRFSGGASVVVSAPTSFKTGRELHLPSMSQLTSKSSGQHFFLRILKVIIQLRDAARTAGLDMTKAPNLYNNRRFSQEIRYIINHMLNDGPPHNSSSSAALPVMPAATGPVTANSTLAPSAPDQQQVARGDNSQPQDPSALESLQQPEESAMEVDAGPGTSASDEKAAGGPAFHLPRLSDQLELDQLWDMLGECLAELARTPDHHAVLILQPAVEAFFIVHAGEKLSKASDLQSSRREDQLAHLNLEMAPPSPATAACGGSSDGVVPAMSRDSSVASVATVSHLPADTQKFLKFAETHRTVLNQILRQSTLPLSDGPFSVLVDHMRILDFDVKRRYFRRELERLNEGARREDLPVHVRRSNVFEDSFRELFRRSPEEWKQRFYIVFEGEEGQDAGGLLREWYIIISHEIFNQNYALFRTSPGDRVTYTISPSSHCNSNHLSYFKFVGRIIAKAVYDNKLLDCYFTRSFYKHMLGLAVKYTDMESEDYAFYQGLHFLLENSVADLGYDLFFSTEVQEFGVTETRELMPDGANILVTDDNKREYVKRVCQMKMTGAIRQQLNAFLEGFYDIIPKKLVSIFTEQELELLISGLPTIDIDDLKGNTEYIKYQATSLQIQWFWRALRSFDQAERANFLQFVTGTSKVPLGGFANLEGMNGTQKFQIHRDDRSTDRLPSAHTCFNQLDLPAYETYDKLRKMLLLAVNECSEGFGLA